jgi:tartrate-resistant acid phosphatase type 5
MAGNHDHFGDIKTQIALSQRYSRWHFPNTFYTHIWEWNELERINIDGNETIVSRRHTIQLVVIDTAVFSGFVDNYDIPFKHPAGPPDEEMYRRGYDWLNSTLSESTADYLWVAGHYPLYTICLQGSNLHLLRDLQPLLNKYGAHYMV